MREICLVFVLWCFIISLLFEESSNFSCGFKGCKIFWGRGSLFILLEMKNWFVLRIFFMWSCKDFCDVNVIVRLFFCFIYVYVCGW